MTQEQALAVMHGGGNVFLTGEPGAGKTYTLNKFIEEARARGKRVAVTASTGIAASHIDGVTIHSWSGLGIKDEVSDAELEDLSYKGWIRKKYAMCDILIIDEVSMLHGSRLDMVERACRWVRGNERPFGGLQIILVGDLYQLPPVTKGARRADYVHESEAWEKANLTPCYLTEQHRQEGSDALLDILRAMRANKIDGTHKDQLAIRSAHEAHKDITRLYTHNVDVDSLNEERLAEIDAEEISYVMEVQGDEWKCDAMKKSILAPEILKLKVGAEVMFVANNFSEGYVNGTRGKVVKFRDNYPVVELVNGNTIQVVDHVWKTYDERGEYVIASVTQLPLRLAWAITVHKSQGMTLDAAEVDLSRAFSPGMGYVALSRVKTLDGLYITGLGEQALLMDPNIHELDKILRKENV